MKRVLDLFLSTTTCSNITTIFLYEGREISVNEIISHQRKCTNFEIKYWHKQNYTIKMVLGLTECLQCQTPQMGKSVCKCMKIQDVKSALRKSCKRTTTGKYKIPIFWSNNFQDIFQLTTVLYMNVFQQLLQFTLCYLMV